MERYILLIGKNQSDFTELRNQIEIRNIRSFTETSLSVLDKLKESKPPFAAFIDIDSVPVNNKCIKQIKNKYPQLRILLLSEFNIHPDIKEAIVQFVYACISKPLDLDEVEFLLKSIMDDNS